MIRDDGTLVDADLLKPVEVGRRVGSSDPVWVLSYPDDSGEHTAASKWFGMPERPLLFDSELVASKWMLDLQKGHAGVHGVDSPVYDPLAAKIGWPGADQAAMIRGDVQCN